MFSDLNFESIKGSGGALLSSGIASLSFAGRWCGRQISARPYITATIVAVGLVSCELSRARREVASRASQGWLESISKKQYAKRVFKQVVNDMVELPVTGAMALGATVKSKPYSAVLALSAIACVAYLRFAK